MSMLNAVKETYTQKGEGDIVTFHDDCPKEFHAFKEDEELKAWSARLPSAIELWRYLGSAEAIKGAAASLKLDALSKQPLQCR